MNSLTEEKRKEMSNSNTKSNSNTWFYAKCILVVLILGGLFFTLGYGYAMKIEYNKCNKYWFDNFDRICAEKMSSKSPYDNSDGLLNLPIINTENITFGEVNT